MDTIGNKCSFVFFHRSSFSSLCFLFKQIFCMKHGDFWGGFMTVASLAEALACMTHESAWSWLWVGVSPLELAWVVPHLHLFLFHVMPSSREAFPHFFPLQIWFHPNVSQLLKSAKRILCVSIYHKTVKQRCRTTVYFCPKSFPCDPIVWTFSDTCTVIGVK